LDDFLSVLSVAVQLVISVSLALGAGALIVSVYEQRKRIKERAVDRFIELVLAKGLFDLLAADWDSCNIYEAYDKVKAGESKTVEIEGSLRRVENIEALTEELVKIWEKALSAHRRLVETGVFCLIPDSVRNEIGDSAETFKQIQDSVISGKVVSALAEQYREQLITINRKIRRIVYRTEL
jgi:hypothetical protein